MARVVVVGAGIAGAACAGVAADAGHAVTVLDRGRAPGGRLASPVVHGRRVDLGAAYFTVRDPRFAAVVEQWHNRGLARPWTDRFDVLDVAGPAESSIGPQRWAAPGGLRTLVRELLAGRDVVLDRNVSSVGFVEGHPTIDGDAVGAVVLAMPDPHAARLADLPVDWIGYEPVIAVAAGWPRRCWSVDDAAFVNGHPAVTLVVDDGARRGDGAPVLVAHTTSSIAAAHLADPAGAVAPVVAALGDLLGATAPDWTHAQRWTFAKPAGTHGEDAYWLDDRLVGVAGDSWCPSGSPRVESAWLSGTALGAELVHRLSG